MAGSEMGGTYYPACIVNLLIRFDEAFNADWKIEDVDAADITPAQRLSRDPKSASSATGIGELPVGKTLFDANANRKGSGIVGRIPLRAAVELNNIRKPGSFNLTFDYKDLPIDPRLVRAVGIEIFMDTVKADNFAAGVLGASRTQTNPSTKGLVGFKPFVATPENLVLKGVVDEWSVAHGTSGSTATLSGRDMVGVMLNTPVTATMLAAMARELNKPIDVVVRNLIRSVGDWTELIEVEAADAAKWPDRIVPKVADIEPLNPLLILQEDKTPTGKKPRVRQSSTGIPRVSAGANQSKLNVWDLITRYCNLVSAVPTFKIKEANGIYKSVLLIVPQWGLYDYYSTSAEGKPGPDGPFNKQRKGPLGQPFKVRRLMYGRNVEELTLERKYQGITARAVEVVSYNPSSKVKGGGRLLSAISGLKQTYANKQGVTQALAASDRLPVRAGEVPSGLAAQDEVLRVEVKGVTDIKQLQTMADGLFDEIMRGETGGSVRTRSLASFGGNNEDPDLLRIRPRDPLELSIDIRGGSGATNGDQNTILAQAKQSIKALEEDLFTRLNDRNLARAIAFSSRNAVAQLQNAFRVNSVSFDWDVKSGISLSIDFHNYIVARNSVLEPNTAPADPPSGGRATAIAAPRRRRARGATRGTTRRRR